MTKRIIEDSEMIINSDGSIFHLHLRPEQLSDKIIVVGDRERVSMVASFFDTKDFEVTNREFHTIGGTYKGKRIMCLSHGIGSGNIDIMMNELDALANVDFSTRTAKDTPRQLEIIRIGTSGGLQTNLPVGSFVAAKKAIGFDGVLNFYASRNKVCDLNFEKAFCEGVKWDIPGTLPYVVDANAELIDRIAANDMVKGCTIASAGFYAPQGRELRLPLADPNLNAKIESFSYNGQCITNYEMESAALQGLAKLMGHKAMTVCCIIANRRSKDATPNYKTAVADLVKTVLDRF